MVQAEKEKKKSRVIDVINQLLDDVNKSRTGNFTPEKVARFVPTQKQMDEYAAAGLKARQMREPELKATPKRIIQEEERMVLDKQMNEKAFGDTLDLATIIENATSAKKLELVKWTKA